MTTVLTRTPTMIPVARPYIGEEEEHGVLSVLRSGWITQGPRVGEFESRFAAYVDTEHAVAVSSCTTALQLALIACGIGPGDEVICPSLSFIATANAIAHTGATPVFADVDLNTYNIDPKSAEAALSPRTKAILAVHQIGLPADLHALKELASTHGVFLVEDAACAIGSEYQGQLIGQPVGDMACFSFHPRKILTTGEGGMITTRDAQVAEKLRRLRQHAMSLSDVARHNSSQVALETYDEVGFNYRMTDMQAAVGIAQLDRLTSFLARRRRLAQRYSDALDDLPSLQVPQIPEQLPPELPVLHGSITGRCCATTRPDHAGFTRKTDLYATRNYGNPPRASLSIGRPGTESTEHQPRSRHCSDTATLPSNDRVRTGLRHRMPHRNADVIF